METQTKEKSIHEMTSKEIEVFMKKKRAAEQKAYEKEKKEYEDERDATVLDLIYKAEAVNEALKEFKNTCHETFEAHKERLDKYGGIRSNSKGGFSLTHANGNMKATRIRSTTPQWDERSEKAIELISDFLRTTVKKRDAKLFEILISFIQKNDKGELEYAKAMHLFKHRDKYDDPRWVKGLDLINESFSIAFRSYGYTFSVKDKEGKWENIDINFTSL
ncbi:DUF3164 family protein [Brumimicrobium mesophilum]|uniref:DUF3164 family protein n=1 Tax=Brumimicrobium mesophilum TaxID=392717 RepID=UPI000D144167|nr:DUF3164 family protein [Brumimicrobium mesophilum]